VQGAFAAFREGPFRNESHDARYELVDGDGTASLDDVQWADWAADGRLLVATVDGRIQARTVSGRTATRVTCEHDLAPLRPDPVPAPPEARTWDRSEG
jgi:hypothetical protein